MAYLLLTEADTQSSALLNAESLEIVNRFEVPGRVALLGTSASGRLALPSIETMTP